MLYSHRGGTVLQSSATRSRGSGFESRDNETHVAALILARGGSKGIPLKNLAKVGGIPLVSRTLIKLLHIGRFTSIWVSTDHDLILREVLKVSADVNIHIRSKESATDTATSVFGIQEFLQYHPEVDLIALIQCTSPFIEETYLHLALNYFSKPDLHIDCCFSVTRSHKLRWSIKENFRITPLNFDLNNRPRRQDFHAEFYENGMFYFAHRSLIEADVLQNENCRLVEVPVENSLEIDNFLDLHIAEVLFKFGL